MRCKLILTTLILLVTAAIASGSTYTFDRGIVVDSGAVSRLADLEVRQLRKCRGKFIYRDGKTLVVTFNNVVQIGGKIEWSSRGLVSPINGEINGFEFYDDRGVHVTTPFITNPIRVSVGSELRTTYTLTYDPTGHRSGQRLTVGDFPAKK